MSRYSDDTIKKLLAVLLVIIMAGMVGQADYHVSAEDSSLCRRRDECGLLT